MRKATVSSLVLSGLISLLFTSASIAHEKVVVVPLSSSKATNPLQGQGRTGVGLMTHDVPNGYCTSSAGINFALSDSFEDWGSAAGVCPKNTWVCSANDLPSTGACPVPTDNYYKYVGCDGILSSSSSRNWLKGWVSDRYGMIYGKVKNTHSFSTYSGSVACKSQRVWCCWK